MSWTPDDDARFRSLVDGHGRGETLAELVSALLTHGFDLQVVPGEHGSHGIALLIDGWYTDRRNDAGLDAETVLPYWQELLDQVRAAAASEAHR